MVDNGRLNDILRELNDNPKVIASLVVSRSGMYIAGESPEGFNLETFVAMAAVLLSAAETASSGLNGKVENVILDLDRSCIMIDGVSKKSVLVVIANTKEDLNPLRAQVREVIGKITGLI